jgi:alanine racemase
MSRNTVARINIAAIQHNLNLIRAHAPHSLIASVVKADGYGHGITRVASALEHSDLLAVATPGEAAALRSGGWAGRLLMLEGFAHEDDFALAQSLNAEVVIHHRSQLAILKQQGIGSCKKFWLKLDTGMHRLGFPVEDLSEVYAEVASMAGDDSIVLMSHFACADEPDNDLTALQITSFDQAVTDFAAPQSLANSAGILNFPQAHRDIIRPGILLYGISPVANKSAAEIGLKPAMTLSSELVAINLCKKGESVGYGATFECPEDMRIGVAAIGYGDGYPRHLRNGTPVLVNGRLSALAGRVSMDLITLDLRGHDDAMTGDPVILWGDGLAVETVAPYADAVPYELICGVTGRVPRLSC